MSVMAKPQFSTFTSPAQALASLCRDDGGTGLVARELAPADLPPAARTLLVHHRHMTITLQDHHHDKVRLTVVKDRLNDGVYWRKIRLHLAGNGQLAECGIVRIFLEYVPLDAANEILARRTPLGAVLIKHHVLRRVEPRWYIESPAAAVASLFEIPTPSAPLHGRISIIYCNGEPAIELLELVPE